MTEWRAYIEFLFSSNAKRRKRTSFRVLDTQSITLQLGPLDSKGRVEVDPWNYTHRLTLYKTLVYRVDHCLYDKDEEKFGNPVWGLPLQHGWQYFSGRLCTKDQQVRLEPTCWWACANYFFSVYPYLGAVGAGVAPPIAPSLPPDYSNNSKWCTSYESCENVTSVKLWKAYFETVRDTRNNCSSSSRAANDDPIFDSLIQAYWDSHTSTILSTEQCSEHLSTLTVPEREFALDWSNVVQFIGPSEFDVNYTMTSVMQSEILPLRMFRENDTIGHVADFSKTVNEGTRLLKLLKNMNDDSKGELLHIYERAMCTSKAREAMRNVMSEFASSVIHTTEDLIRILFDLVFRSPFCKKN